MRMPGASAFLPSMRDKTVSLAVVYGRHQLHPHVIASVAPWRQDMVLFYDGGQAVSSSHGKIVYEMRRNSKHEEVHCDVGGLQPGPRGRTEGQPLRTSLGLVATICNRYSASLIAIRPSHSQTTMQHIECLRRKCNEV